jgi:hypothetical protein
MRYYEIIVTKKGSSDIAANWTSFPNGVFNPGALNVQFDMPIFRAGIQNSAVTISIEGISLQDLNQAQNFAGMILTIKGGMGKGLPLVNPSQAGVLFSGEIYNAFGNWEGTEQTLDFVVFPETSYTTDSPGNFVLNWNAGQALGDALTQALNVAYPGVPVKMNISSSLVNNFDFPHFCSTFDQLGSLVHDFTKDNFDNPVHMSMQNGSINVFDGTYNPNPIQLAFTDFIGQPTWIENSQLQIKTVLRADIAIGGQVLMPQGLQNAPGIIMQSSQALPGALKYKSTFSGNFGVAALRHVGNFRSADAANWCTVINCVPPDDFVTPSASVGS